MRSSVLRAVVAVECPVERQAACLPLEVAVMEAVTLQRRPPLTLLLPKNVQRLMLISPNRNARPPKRSRELQRLLGRQPNIQPC